MLYSQVAFLSYFLQLVLLCLAYPPVRHLGGDLASSASCDYLQPPTRLPQTQTPLLQTELKNTGVIAVISIAAKMFIKHVTKVEEICCFSQNAKVQNWVLSSSVLLFVVLSAAAQFPNYSKLAI